MLRLLVNDFRLNAVFVFWVFLMFNVQLVLMAKLGILGIYSVGSIQTAGIVFASAIIVAVFLREELNKGQIVIRSLPISHAKVVSARYLSISLLFLWCVLYGILFWVIVGSFGQYTYMEWHFRLVVGDPGFSMAHSLIARALAISTTVAIGVPLIVRFGTFWRILIIYAVLMTAWSIVIFHLLQLSSVAAHFFGSLSAWVLVALVFISVILAGSIWLSTWLYGRKEL